VYGLNTQQGLYLNKNITLNISFYYFSSSSKSMLKGVVGPGRLDVSEKCFIMCVTERRTYHHVPLCIVCDCYSMAYLSVLYQACVSFVSFWDVFISVFS
jgi:hypothetical protein